MAAITVTDGLELKGIIMINVHLHPTADQSRSVHVCEYPAVSSLIFVIIVNNHVCLSVS